MVLSCHHFKTKHSLQYWLHRSSKIAAYSNRNNSPGTIYTVYSRFFFLEHTAEFKETDHKSQFCMCEKNKNNIQTRKVNLHIFISFFRAISPFSQLQTHTITKISLKNFHSKISRKKINFDAEFLAVSHAHNLMLEWSKFSSQKGWQPTRRV